MALRPQLADVSWEMMIRAVEKVRQRLTRAVEALERAAVPYAVCGGHAVAAWVARIDETAVRNTRDIDLLLRRDDLQAAALALKSAGFIHRHAAGIDMFIDGPTATARDAVHVVVAGEKVRPNYQTAAPDVTDSEKTGAFQVLSLEALVQMKLTSFRDRDRTHLRDLLDVGLIDSTWCNRLPQPLAVRLRQLIDNPED